MDKYDGTNHVTLIWHDPSDGSIAEVYPEWNDYRKNYLQYFLLKTFVQKS